MRNTRLRPTILLSWLLILISAATGSANQETLTARVTDWRPSYWQENGKWVGMDIDFYKALAKASGLRFAYKNLPWSRALRSIETGDCTIMTQLSKTPERQKFMYFLGPYALEEMILIVKREDTSVVIQNLDQMAAAAKERKLKIGIEENAFISEELNYRLETDADFAAAFVVGKLTLHKMVSQQRLFGAIEQRLVANYRIKTDPEFMGLAIHPFLIRSGVVYFGVTKRISKENLAKLRTACTTLMKDGTFKAILDKWSH